MMVFDIGYIKRRYSVAEGCNWNVRKVEFVNQTESFVPESHSYALYTLCLIAHTDRPMRLKRTIAAFSLLTSVLLGGLVAPLSHFAFMAFSDAYAMHGETPHAMAMHAEGVSLDADQDLDHVECPYAAFFLNQASAVSGDDPGLSESYSATCLTEAPVSAPRAASVHISPIRGPPGQSA